jgi:hypothetical protein
MQYPILEVPLWWVVQTASLKNASYRVGQKGTGDELIEPSSRGPEILGTTSL